ncbi:thioredoxin-like 4, chloroplastic [Arachis hypogaea]|uniref:thioredoxin-like 4, chloroplastic n=1 Tax=Arachis hypogaea TaxID=3818 RepID=UPI003B21D7FB
MPQVVYPRQDILHTYSFAYFRQDLKKPADSGIFHVGFSLFSRHNHSKLCLGDTKIKPLKKMRRTFCPCSSTGVVADEHQEDFPNVNEDLCPVDCVREFTTDEEFCRILDKAKGTGSFVIVDFYRTSRGSCKYIEQGFAKLCKKAGDDEALIIFLKYNVNIYKHQ